jgi:glycopeptide antibiotics resistance protein
MVRLLSIGIEIFSSVIFVIPAVFILQYIIFKQRNLSKTAATAVVIFYLVAVFSVVGIPTVTSWHVDPAFNLIPIIDIVNSPLDYIRNTVLNIILFVPFGFLLATLWKEYRSLRTVALAGLTLSILIEVLQIFTFRLTDVDDLITNTAGAVLGFYIAKLFSFRLPFGLAKNEENGYSKYEPIIVLAAAFVIGFCFKSLVSNIIWDKLLLSPLWESIR